MTDELTSQEIRTLEFLAFSGAMYARELTLEATLRCEALAEKGLVWASGRPFDPRRIYRISQDGRKALEEP